MNARSLRGWAFASCVALHAAAASAQDPLAEPRIGTPIPSYEALDAQAPAAPFPTADRLLAIQLANPIANIASLPLESNFDFGLGVGAEGFRYVLDVEPVIPIGLGGDWTLITRTVFPVIHQENVVTPQGMGGQSIAGLGDTTVSVFLAPPGLSGAMVGVGPALVLPTSTDDQLAPGHFGAGPTAVLVWQGGGVTLGVLANHVWTVTDEPDPYSQTYVQPFATYVHGAGTSFSLSSESSYEWRSSVWTVPLILGVSQIARIGPVPFQLGLAGKWYAERPVMAPDWGLRATVTVVLPSPT